MGKFLGAILIATYLWHHQFNKWHHFFKKLLFSHDNIIKHFFKAYFSENQINISEQKVPLLKSYRKCYQNVETRLSEIFISIPPKNIRKIFFFITLSTLVIFTTSIYLSKVYCGNTRTLCETWRCVNTDT